MDIITKIYHSPCRDLLLGVCDCKLCLCDWHLPLARANVWERVRKGFGAEALTPGEDSLLEAACTALDDYFQRGALPDDMPLAMCGTQFQKQVWSALLDIEPGVTVAYLEVAAKIGRPSAVRAVAHAIGQNALSIFIPCHRVVASSASLAGYAGGLDAKKFLLSHENA